MKKLTVLSFGGGQDSTAILYKLIYDQEFRTEYAPNDLLVIMADTMNEHDETYAHVSEVSILCEKHDIPFFLIDPKEGYAPVSWSGGLIEFYEAGNRIGSKCFPKTCTDNLKIKPIYNFLDKYIHNTYGTEKVGRKGAIKEFAINYGKIDVLIGIAEKEESRASSNEESPHPWMKKSINKVYPLLDLGMDRQACQDYISGVGHTVPPPSNCILCPFMSEQELLYLYLKMPHWYNKWVELEANKIKANAANGDLKMAFNASGELVGNMGVWGVKLLPQKLEEAIKKYGHMSMEDLEDYKMSHGHCVKSKY